MKHPRHITVSQAARSFADIVERAFHHKEITVLTRNGTAVAHIAPVAPIGVGASEALARWRKIAHLDGAEAVAMMKDINASRSKLIRRRRS